ncbi:hypothetical protein SANTM175S_00502 [Streptomyces antimycoticus]
MDSRSSARSFSGSRPITETSPPSRLRIPSTYSTALVWPVPFGPRMPKISPSSTEKDTSCTAT